MPREFARRARAGAGTSLASRTLVAERRTVARRASLLALGLVVFTLCSARYPRERLGYEALRSTRVVDRAGHLLWERRGGRGTVQRPVPLAEVSRWVVLATLAGEDARFRRHPGVDPLAITRALWLDARERRFAYGGSTLTQQLAKNLAPEPRTFGGKLHEAWDAWRLERTLTKDEILAQYLNRADYGHGTTGIEAAADRYFGKRARDLDLAEGSLLAVLPRAPSLYDPVRHPGRARARRAHVLGLMVARGYVDPAAATAAAAAPLPSGVASRPPRARHALDHAMSHGHLPRGAGEVRLTIDAELTAALEQRARSHLASLADAGAEQAGIVVIENATGDVLAMVGSRRYEETSASGAVNVTTALRAPGSTLKPFVYALAFEDGAHPSTPVVDEPTHWRAYQPRALREHHFGAVALRDALGSSLNVPAVRAAEGVGVERLAALLHDAGLERLDPGAPHGLSLALGGTSVSLVELTNAYATLARGGEFLPWRIAAEEPRVRGRRVLTAAASFLVTDALADARARRLEFGLETPLELPFPVAAKTGTSQAFTDNVAIGYSSELTVGVWVGNFDGRPLRGLLAMRGAAPLFREVMLRAHRGRAPRAFTAPPGVVRREVCVEDGTRTGSGCARRRREWVHEPTPAPGSPPGVTANGAGPIVISAPPAGARFLVDPLLDPSRQRLALRATVAEGERRRVRWLVDGELVEEARGDEVVHWTIARGRHRIRVEAVDDPADGDELELEVEG